MARRASKDDAAARSAKRDADSTAPVRTIFLARDAASTVHRHDEHAAWIHVVSGEIAEERWTRDAEGGFLYERRVLKRGQSMAAPANALHRVTALEDAAFVTTCLGDCARAKSAPRSEVEAATLLARDEVDQEWATATVIGEPAPT